MKVKEAFEIAKKHETSECYGYTEYKDLYMFNFGDAEYWLTVNKKTKEVKDLWRGSLIFEHLDDKEFCEELNNACIAMKPIPV